MTNQNPSEVFDWVAEAEERLQDSIGMRMAHDSGSVFTPKQYAELARKLTSSAVKLATVNTDLARDWTRDLEREVELLVLDAGKYANRMKKFKVHWLSGQEQIVEGENEADALRRGGFGSIISSLDRIVPLEDPTTSAAPT